MIYLLFLLLLFIVYIYAFKMICFTYIYTHVHMYIHIICIYIYIYLEYLKYVMNPHCASIIEYPLPPPPKHPCHPSICKWLLTMNSAVHRDVISRLTHNWLYRIFRNNVCVCVCACVYLFRFCIHICIYVCIYRWIKYIHNSEKGEKK